MHEIATIIAPTFFAILVGYLYGRLRRASPAALIDIAMYIAVPCLAFTSIMARPIVLGQAAKIWASCVFIMAGTYVFARVVLTLKGGTHSGVYLPIIFSNSVNIPFPIIYMAFGAEGLANAALFYIPNGILIYSLGIYMAAGQKGLKVGVAETLRTPLLYAAVLGLVLNLSGVRVPGLVMDALGLVGRAGIPLVLIVLGISIGRIKFSHLPLTVFASVTRMGGGLAFGLLVVWLLGLTGIPRSVVIFDAAMPAAVFTSMIAAKYDNEVELVSSVVLMTTLLSVAAIPLLLYFLT